MFLKWSKIVCFVLIPLTIFYSAFCFKVSKDMYRIVQSHAGVKQCAVDQSGKKYIVAVTVSNKTQTCEGFPQKSDRNISAHDGYAVKIQSVLNLQPPVVLEGNITNIQTIPGGFDVTSGTTSTLDIFISPISDAPISDYAYQLSLSEEPLAFDVVEYGYKGWPVHNSSKRISLYFTTHSSCFMSGFGRLDQPFKNITYLPWEQISVVLQGESLKILATDREVCLFILQDPPFHVGMFRYLYASSVFGNAYFHKIQSNKEYN